MKKKKSLVGVQGLLLVALCLCLLMPAAAFGKMVRGDDVFADFTEEGAQSGGIYNTYMNNPRSLDPHQETYGNTTAITMNTNNGLLRMNQKNDGVELDLCESWKRLDDRTYEFKIHQGVHFQNVPPVNGRELTSADVKYSLERVAGMYPPGQFQHKYYFKDKIESIETPDKYTVIIKTKKPYAPLVNYIAAPWTAIVAKEVVEANKDLKRVAIGSGPFILKDYVLGSHITMVKNPDYFRKGKPYLDGINFKIIADPNAAMAAYIAGNLDTLGVYFFQLKTVQEKASDSIISVRQGMHMWTLRTPPVIEGKIPPKPPFDKKEVRQAIGMAIDKVELLKLSWGGFGRVQVGPVPSAVRKYALGPEDQIKYDPEKAKELLKAAGYPNGFTTELMTWNASYISKPAQVIKDMLAKVGITVNLKLLEQPQYFNLAYRYDYQMALHIMTAGTDPAEWLTPYFGPLEGSTYYKWSNPEIWDMIVKQEYIMDEDKRIDYIKDVQRKVMDDAPNFFLYTQDRFGARRPYMHTKLYTNDFQPLVAESYWMEKH